MILAPTDDVTWATDSIIAELISTVFINTSSCVEVFAIKSKSTTNTNKKVEASTFSPPLVRALCARDHCLTRGIVRCTGERYKPDLAYHRPDCGGS